MPQQAGGETEVAVALPFLGQFLQQMLPRRPLGLGEDRPHERDLAAAADLVFGQLEDRQLREQGHRRPILGDEAVDGVAAARFAFARASARPAPGSSRAA